MSPIDVTASDSPISVSASGTRIDATVSGGVGPAGPAATIQVGSVTTGAPGSSASVVNAGTSGAAVLNFTIPRGADGAAGPAGSAGATGATGAAGAAASVSVGTVTTGAAGSSASVTNVGTSSAAVFNFTIPAGATGATGPQGATGPAGTTTWSGITDKPSTFAPSAHAASHAAGGADELFDQSLNQGSTPAFAGMIWTAESSTVYMFEDGGDGFVLEGGPTGGAAVLQLYFDDGDINCGNVSCGAITAESINYGALPWATAIAHGAVRAGSGVTVTDGVISVSTSYAATSHTHGNITNAGAIGTTASLPIITTTSGVLTTGAFGTSSGQFAEGDHTHSQLHDRSHAITSTSDHTATAWRVFYSDASGVKELALGASGTVLQSGGTTSAPSFGSVQKTITTGTAAPTGGSDGDIYLQYTA